MPALFKILAMVILLRPISVWGAGPTPKAAEGSALLIALQDIPARLEAAASRQEEVSRKVSQQIESCLTDPEHPKAGRYDAGTQGYAKMLRTSYKAGVVARLAVVQVPVSPEALAEVGIDVKAVKAELVVLKRRLRDVEYFLRFVEEEEAKVARWNHYMTKMFLTELKTPFNTGRRRCRWYKDDFQKAHSAGVGSNNGVAMALRASEAMKADLSRKKTELEGLITQLEARTR